MIAAEAENMQIMSHILLLVILRGGAHPSRARIPEHTVCLLILTFLSVSTAAATSQPSSWKWL